MLLTRQGVVVLEVTYVKAGVHPGMFKRVWQYSALNSLWENHMLRQHGRESVLRWTSAPLLLQINVESQSSGIER